MAINISRWVWGLVLLTSVNFVFAYDDTPNLIKRGLEARKLCDYSTAFLYFKTAAEEGNAEAQYDLAYCYLSSQGVREDDPTAVKWLQKSAAQGFGQAEYSLGYCYQNGLCVDKDPVKAAALFQKAAQDGFPGAQSSVKAPEAPSPEAPAPPTTTESDAGK